MAEARASSPCRTARRSRRCSPIGPLHRAAGLRSAGAVVLPGRERRGPEGNARACGADREAPRAGGVARATRTRASLPQGELFAKPIAFNVVAKIGEFEDDGFTGEEAKMMAEPRKILSLPDLEVLATSVRVPVVTGHAVSILAEFARPIDVAEARARAVGGAGGHPDGRPGGGRVPEPAGRRGPRRRLCRADPAGARPRRRARAVQLRRQPPQGRGARRGPDRRGAVPGRRRSAG